MRARPAFRSATLTLTALAAWAIAADARAQQADRSLLPEPKGDPPRPLFTEPDTAPGEPPLARTGFQLAFRVGPSMPFGKASGSARDRQASTFAWQLGPVVEIGAKPIPELLIAAYAGFTFGDAGGAVDDECFAFSLSCDARTTRFGLQVAVSLLPARRLNPWIGYGFGYESSTLTLTSSNKRTTTQSLSGVEFAHFLAGLDVRVSRVIGIGPFIDVALGSYGDVEINPPLTNGVRNITLDDQAVHGWVTIGARLVFFP